MTRTITEQVAEDTKPLAARMRPRSLDEFVGQEAVVGPGTALRRAIESGSVGSLVLWGPPGVGKTSLAYLIVAAMEQCGGGRWVERVSAVTAGVKELRAVIKQAEERRAAGERCFLIVDEIHRFNKAQQDVLLPVVEDGLVTLIGATTENPYFEVVAALISRSQVVRLESLKDDAVRAIVQRAVLFLNDETGSVSVSLTAEAEDTLVMLAGGDARRALNLLESAFAGANGEITTEALQALAQQQVVQYDKAGDAHYDTISAFIKSLRGSDPDAALFYLFRMLVAGEDPKFIVRRMFILASEDIGNADPHALMLVSAVAHGLEWVGLPEAEFFLAHAATYLAAAPKSNAVYRAMAAAKGDVKQHGNAIPPGHVTNAPIKGMKQHGRGVGYQYPHDFPGGLVAQEYRPEVVQGNVYYEPGSEGFEKEVKRRVEAARKVLFG